MNIELEKLGTDLATRAAGVVITDQASADMATELIISGKAIVKKIKEFFSPLKESAKVAHQGLVEKEKAELAKVQPAVDRLDLSLSTWRAGEERKRLAAATELRRQEDIRRQLEEEALRKVREAEERAERERQRLEREAERLCREAANKANDDATLKRIEEEREKLRLQAAENQKRVEEATDKAIDEAAKAEAALVPAPIVPEAPKTEGLAMRNNWCFEVVDPMAIPRKYLTIDTVTIGKVVRVLKDQASIPGIRVFNHPTMSGIGHGR